jgi:hypothetical protein
VTNEDYVFGALGQALEALAIRSIAQDHQHAAALDGRCYGTFVPLGVMQSGGEHRYPAVEETTRQQGRSQFSSSFR